MLLHSLHLIRFRQHADTEITFETGLTGVIGTNGAGKSTILEAIGYALFGADAIRGTKQSIRWNRAPARQVAEVTLNFEVNGKGYILTRSENSAVLDEWTEGPGQTSGGANEIADGTSAVNAYIPTLLGMTLREFQSTFFVGQKDLARIASMGATERQAFFREIMGVGRVDEAVKAARQQKNDLARERDGLAAGLGERWPLLEETDLALNATLDAREAVRANESDWKLYSAKLATASQDLHAADEKRAEHDRLTREVAAAEQEVRESGAEVERVDARLVEVAAASDRVEARASEIAQLPALRAERESLVEARATEREAQALVERHSAIAAEIAHAQEEMAALEDADAYSPARLNEAEEEMAAVQARLDDLVDARKGERARAIMEASRLRSVIEDTTSALDAIDALGTDGACPTCTRTLGEHYDTVRGGMVAALDHARSAYLAAQKGIDRQASEEEQSHAAQAEALKGEIVTLSHQAAASASAARDALRLREEVRRKTEELTLVKARIIALPSVLFDQRALETVERLISEAEAAERALTSDRALAAERDGLVREREAWDARASAALERGAVASAALRHLAYDAEQYAALSIAAGEAQRKRDAAREALVRAEEAVRAAEGSQTRALRALEEYDRRAELLTDLTERLRVTDTAALRLHDFRVAVASGIRPEMEELVSGFVSVLTDGRYEAVTLDENFECRLYRSGVAIDVISGGEEDVAAVAMRLATSQMIAERAGHPLSLLILDEPFGSQDEARRDNMLTLFRRLEGVFPQLLLISHVPEVQHAVDHAVLLEYDEAAGCSRVKCLSGVAA